MVRFYRRNDERHKSPDIFEQSRMPAWKLDAGCSRNIAVCHPRQGAGLCAELAADRCHQPLLHTLTNRSIDLYREISRRHKQVARSAFLQTEYTRGVII